MRRIALFGVILLTVSLGMALFIAPAAASEEIDLEAAEEDEGEVSFTFTTGEETEQVTIDSGFSSDFEFESWSGGTETQEGTFDVDSSTTYTVTYSIESPAGDTNLQYSDTVTVEDADNFQELANVDLVANLLQPEFGDEDAVTVDAVFEPGDGLSVTVDADVEFENQGDGVMVIDDVTADSSSFDIDSATVTEEPDRIDSPTFGTESEPVSVSIDVSDSIGNGDAQVPVELEDNLGNSQTATITVDGIQPPAAGTPASEVDLGEILVGESASATFTLTERGGYESIDGLDRIFQSTEFDGDISFDGLETRSIMADGSATQSVEIAVDETASRGEIAWDIGFEPTDPNGIPTEESVRFRADAIYPPYYESFELSDRSFVFDQPRDQRNSFTQETEVVIENGGDLSMDLFSVSAAVETAESIEATVVDAPTSIPARSSATATVEITAGTDVPEGEWDVVVEAVADEPASLSDETTGTTTTTSSVSVEHETELAIDETSFDAGSLIITDRESRESMLSERLGYQDIEGFSIEQISGPDAGWLTIQEQPEALSAGESAPFAFDVEFDTSAEVFSTYTWEFEVDGENVDGQTISFEAVPEPFDFSDIVAELESLALDGTAEEERVATEMATALESLEADLQADETEADRDDIPTLVTGASSTTILIDATQEAERLIESGEHEQAQVELVRATAAFNTLALTSEEITTAELRDQVDTARQSAAVIIEELIDQQQDHYEAQLEDEETTILEEAQINRELARIAELSGNEQEATERREAAEESFEMYSELVSSANEDLLEAREQRDELDDDLFATPLGQRVFFIGSYTSYESGTTAVLDSYESAAEQFEAAGASERAETARNERAEMADAYDQSLLFSAGIGAVLGVGLLAVIVWEIRALYRYRVDSESAVSGDFLLPWAEES